MEKKVRLPIAAFLFAFMAVRTVFLMMQSQSFGSYSVINILISLALSIVLFMRKRNLVMIAVLAGATLLRLTNFSLQGILTTATYALLSVFAFGTCEQTIIKGDFSKIKAFAVKFFFLPAVLWMCVQLTRTGQWWKEEIQNLNRIGFWQIFHLVKNYLIGFRRTIIPNLLELAALLSLGLWLKDPFAKSVSANKETNDGSCAAEEYGEIYCGLGKHIVLCLFTFGIWYLIWIYRTTRYLNKAPDAVAYNPVSKLLLCLFVPFYQIYWFYKHGQRIDGMSRQKKLNNSDMATLCLILGIFIPIVACILMQDRMNTLCTSKAVSEEQKTDSTEIEQLKKYKELLDSGVITEEEFDTKKKQLLGL